MDLTPLMHAVRVERARDQEPIVRALLRTGAAVGYTRAADGASVVGWASAGWGTPETMRMLQEAQGG